MARQRRNPRHSSAPGIPLGCPPPLPDDVSPTAGSLLEAMEKRQLGIEVLAPREAVTSEHEADADADEGGFVLGPTAQRLAETALWTLSLAAVHLTFDVLAQNQYGTEIDGHYVALRALRAWLVFGLLFYHLHPHHANGCLLPVPRLPAKRHHAVRQAVFLAASLAASSYMIYVTNSYGYLAVMEQTPPLACIWLWSVAEMDLSLATISVLLDLTYIWWNGFGIK